MKIKWLGHASFLITSEGGTRIITDPYTPGGPLTYGSITEAAEVVTVSHEHGDHNNSGAVKGNPTVIKGAGSHQAKGIAIQGVATNHDEAEGSQRGKNTVFCFAVDGVRVCHLGDLGHALSPLQEREVGTVDILLTPVGGTYTVDAAAATQLCSRLRPKVVIPMHFRTAGCGYPIAGVEDFTKGKKNVRQVKGSEVELKASSLPSEQEVVVLTPAL